MGFFHPEAWWWAGLAVLIALLYLWNASPSRHELATYWLWQRALARRPAWVPLRFWLSLAAQIVILLLLVAALAEPYWKAAVAGRRTLVLVLDVSASMLATDVKPSRFAAAQAEAQRMVEQLQPGERMAVLIAGGTVRTECRMTDRPGTLQAAIAAISPTGGGARMKEAVALARRMVEGQPNPHIVLLTDGCFPEAESMTGEEHVFLTRIGEGGRNQGVTRFAARRDRQEPEQQWVLVETMNSSDVPASVPMRVALDDGSPHSETVELPAGGVARTTLVMPIEDRGVLTLRLPVDDDLTEDNQASVPVSGYRRPNVFFVSGAPPEAEGQQAIRDALVAVTGIELLAVERLPATLPEHALAVFYRQTPEQLPDCPLLVIAPQNASDLWDVTGVVRGSESAVASVRRDSPLLAGVRLEDVVVEQASKLEFKQPAMTLAEAGSGAPLYSLVERPAGPVLVLHVDLQREHSDLVLRSDFPRLIERAVRWLSGVADEISIAVGVDDRPLTEEDAASAMNILSRTESDIRAGINLPSRSLEGPAPARDQPLWMLLAGAVAVLLVAEWCLFHRKLVV